MQLKDICVLDVACCTPDLSIAAAARMMRQQHAGDLIVVDDNDSNREPVGIITDRDIVVEVLAKGLDPDKTSVGEIMTTRLVIAAGSEDAATALERMRAHGVRRVPAVDDEGFVLGIITLDDMMRMHADQAVALRDIVTAKRSHEHRTRR